MAESVTPLEEALRALERTTASISASMILLLDHFGAPEIADDEVDRLLAAGTAYQDRRGLGA